MSVTLTECPNCHTPLKNGFMSSVKLLEDYKTQLINAVNNTSTPGYCTKCGDTIYWDAKSEVNTQIEDVKKLIWKALGFVPVISAQNPLNWDYEVLTMVTGQSTTGTGVFAELSASWTDFVGGQSTAYSTKLKMGEQLCFAQLRRQALDLGGNAVIATDIDYSEVGGDKGMLMVCMAGTAVVVKNPDVFGRDRAAKIAEIKVLSERLTELVNTSNLILKEVN